MSDNAIQSVRGRYDQLADEYARRISKELQHKPFDGELLNRFTAQVSGHGEVSDMDCGPGHIARYLCDAGTTVFGYCLTSKRIAIVSAVALRNKRTGMVRFEADKC